MKKFFSDPKDLQSNCSPLSSEFFVSEQSPGKKTGRQEPREILGPFAFKVPIPNPNSFLTQFQGVCLPNRPNNRRAPKGFGPLEPLAGPRTLEPQRGAKKGQIVPPGVPNKFKLTPKSPWAAKWPRKAQGLITLLGNLGIPPAQMPALLLIRTQPRPWFKNSRPFPGKTHLEIQPWPKFFCASEFPKPHRAFKVLLRFLKILRHTDSLQIHRTKNRQRFCTTDTMSLCLKQPPERLFPIRVCPQAPITTYRRQ